jgi:GAF domain-containing protein
MPSLPSFEELQELLDVDPPSPAGTCEAIARIFEVRLTEVGLLAIEGEFLKFVFPAELQSAGVIPLSSSAVAARSAAQKQAVLFNRFPHVPHHTVFEQIKLSDSKPLAELPDPIQKLMSAPVIAEDGTVIGVLQVCRKGMTPGIAGPDFTGADLRLLETVARRVAVLMIAFGIRKHPAATEILHVKSEKLPKRANA